MTKIYTLTQQIHKTIDLINKKYGLEINIYYYLSYSSYKDENDYTVVESWRCKDKSVYDSFFLIEEKQIKKILNALKDVLGENPKYTEIEKHCTYEECSECGSVDTNPEIYLYSTALCHKWLDGLNPMFESEPEKVLEELLEVLQKLIKN
jgi:hypothetical protein